MCRVYCVTVNMKNMLGKSRGGGNTFETRHQQDKRTIKPTSVHVCIQEGGIRVCSIAVLGYFWCGVAVIFISKYGIAVFRDQAVCGEFKFCRGSR